MATVHFTKKGPEKGNRGDIKHFKLADKLHSCSWWDKKAVNMLSSFPTYKKVINRNEKDAKTGAHVVTKLVRPTNIGWYNKGMGCTDLMHQLVSYYRTSVKTKRWPHTIIFHFLLVSVINAWILFKECHQLRRGQENVTLFSFIMNVVDEMCPQLTTTLPVLLADAEIHFAPKHRRETGIISNEKRLKGQHFPFSLPTLDPNTGQYNRKLCSNPSCTMRTTTFCKTCGVALCISLVDGTTCFEKFHQA